jgi:hypothetical protein
MEVFAEALSQKVKSWNGTLRIKHNFAFAPQTQYDSMHARSMGS